MPSKPRVVFVLGGPGSGKGTHCKLLKDHYNLTHYSVGSILRDLLKSGSKEAKQISKLMKEGKMVSADFVVKGIKDAIMKGDRNKLILLDGFPRNQDNIDSWDKIVGSEIKVEFLLFIEVGDEEMRRRLLNRGKTSGRLDDNPQVIQKRLITFHAQTEPVLIHYKRLYKEGKSKVLNVNGELTMEGTQGRIRDFFNYHKVSC